MFRRTARVGLGALTLASALALGGCDKPPGLQRCEPDFGSLGGGDDVRLLGRGFRAGLTVRFGRKVAKVTSVRDDAVEVKTPPSGQPGPIDVTVTQSDGTTFVLAGGFRYQESTLPGR